MSAEELVRLREKYIGFKEKLEYIIDRNAQAAEKILGADNLIKEGYSIDDEPADSGYIEKAISTIDEAGANFKRVLLAVNSKLNSLARDIETARDKELAEQIMNGKVGSDGNKM